MIERYITVCAIVIIIRILLILFYVPIMQNTSLAQKGRKFFFNRYFGSTNDNTWRMFYASLLWLIVYYYESIKLLGDF